MPKKIYVHSALLTALHLLVDGLCACSMMLVASGAEAFTVLSFFAIYNLVAFGSQPLAGFFVDRDSAKAQPLLLSFLLLSVGAALSLSLVREGALPLACALLLGAGNSLFHVYGGKFVALAWQNDIRPLGLFVSTGAVGLTIGLGLSSVGLTLALVLSIALLVFWHWRLIKAEPIGLEGKELSAPSSLQPNRTRAFSLGFVLCLIFLVAGRSFLGKAIPMDGLNSSALLILLSAAAMIGKAAGGFIAHRIGLRFTLLGSLLLSAGAFLLCRSIAAFIPITVFLINLSMSCTLYLANRAMPRHLGVAFGLLAAALLPGYWLGSLFLDSPLAQYLLGPLLSTILIESVMLLYLRQTRWQILASSVLMNILTNVPLNLFALHFPFTWGSVIGLEILVIIIEFLLYLSLSVGWRKALTYSVLCNASSYLSGLIFSVIY